MPEYIYLLEHRLSTAQKHALVQVRDAAREVGATVFLTGGAVRDLTTGSSVRNLDFAVQGNALELQAALTTRGGELWGKHDPTRSLTFWFPGSVRVDVASAHTEEYPKPGKPVYHWSSMVEDLRRRDFTANAMALSLNEGSYGLLLDPLNGVADIEARLLRLASNYGFLEDPSRLIRATRLLNRLGWQMDEKTATRYANAKEAHAIKALSPYLRGYELEKIASEEQALDTLKALEAEGWMQYLLPGWTSAQADVGGIESLRRNWIQLLMQGVTADLTVAHFELLTAKLDSKHLTELKNTLVHPGLLRHWESLDESAKEFGRQLTGKGAATPSATWKLLTTHPAEPILWLAHTRKAGSAADAKFKNFFTVWPEFKKRVPAALMLEMRITPELPGYPELLEQLFYQLIDGNLETDEQMRAFLEPYSPPAPPPVPTIRRSRAKKSESKTKRRTAAPDDEDDEDADHDDEDEDAADGVAEDEDEEDDPLGAAITLLRGVPDEADALDDPEVVDKNLAKDLEKDLAKDLDNDIDDDDDDSDDTDEAEDADNTETSLHGLKASASLDADEVDDDLEAPPAPPSRASKAPTADLPTAQPAPKAVPAKPAPSKPPVSAKSAPAPARHAPVKAPAKGVPPAPHAAPTSKAVAAPPAPPSVEKKAPAPPAKKAAPAAKPPVKPAKPVPAPAKPGKKH